MKQLLQNLQDGKTAVVEVPLPGRLDGTNLIANRVSLISAGTERKLIDYAKANLFDKARRQPDKVRQVLERVKTEGLLPTIESVQANLGRPIALGYCGAGVDIETGQRLASNGHHAEVVRVPENLCAPIPNSVPDDAAAFTVLGAIALQGVRLARPTLGESFVVTGLGLVGLLAVQILRANGCRVLGIDFDSRRLALAEAWGAKTVDLSKGEDPLAEAEAFTGGRGVDGALICATTKSDEPMHQAAQMCRQRGRIVLTGVTGLQLSRADFYKKELSFQVSCSYGPGRYDPSYEEGGNDYPYGHVRWTEQRNFEAVLEMMADGKLETAPLISHRFPFEEAEKAYELLTGKEPHLGILLEYSEKPREELLSKTIRVGDPLERDGGLGTSQSKERLASGGSVVSLGFIGAGEYATKALLPALRDAGVELKTIASSGGLSAANAARRFGFEEATTDVEALIAREDVNTVVIATRHDSHAELVCRTLRAGKHVFVEKPLAINAAELEEIGEAYAAAPGLLMVGFNRRFAPQIVKMKELLGSSKESKSIIITVNAGARAANHWSKDPKIGGGRIVGEGCHFIDLARFLVGAPVTSVHTARLAADTVTITIAYQDGSTAAIHYFANGSKSFPKERIEIFRAGRILQLDNFRKLKGYGWPGFRGMNLWRQEKGNAACVKAFVDAIRTSQPSPIPFEELVETTRIAL